MGDDVSINKYDNQKYGEILNNISEKLKEFERFGSILGLERMKKLLDILGNPQNDMKVIHVAGTNGKGSIGHYI